MERILHSLGRVAGVGVLVFALLHILAGFGLLKMQNWGRLLTLLFSAITGKSPPCGLPPSRIFCHVERGWSFAERSSTAVEAPLPQQEVPGCGMFHVEHCTVYIVRI